MVNEINKIIRNALLSGGDGIFLPGIGSLTVETVMAVRRSRKAIEPPHKTIVFRECELGVSIIDEIVSLGVEAVQAHKAYNDWRVYTYSNGTLNIAGIGTLKDETFVADKALLAALNPQNATRIRINPKPDKMVYIFAVLCCLFAVCVALYVWRSNQDKGAKSLPQIAVVTTSQTESEVEEAVASNDPVPQESVVAPASLPAEKTDKNIILRTSSGHSYLVLGIFSTEENAFKAVKNAESNYPYADCRVYHYADKFMVSVFESSTVKECSEYKRTIDNYFPETWIYTKK